MAAPHWLFYKSKNLTKINVCEPTDNLDVDKFIRGNRACWKKQDINPEIKPKQLVLNDWTATEWNVARIHSVKDALNKLKKEGFAIYVYHADKLILLEDLANLDDRSFRSSIAPEFNDKIKKQMSRKGVSADHYSTRLF